MSSLSSALWLTALTVDGTPVRDDAVVTGVTESGKVQTLHGLARLLAAFRDATKATKLPSKGEAEARAEATAWKAEAARLEALLTEAQSRATHHEIKSREHAHTSGLVVSEKEMLDAELNNANQTIACLTEEVARLKTSSLPESAKRMIETVSAERDMARAERDADAIKAHDQIKALTAERDEARAKESLVSDALEREQRHSAELQARITRMEEQAWANEVERNLTSDALSPDDLKAVKSVATLVRALRSAFTE